RQGPRGRAARVRSRPVISLIPIHPLMKPRLALISSTVGGLVCATALTTLGANSPQPSQEREAPPMRQVQEIPLPGVQGRLDHFTIDPKRKRVIFSGLGNN